MQADHYLGINQIYTSDYKASGSRFIGFLFPCNESLSFEKNIKKNLQTPAMFVQPA
jgi:putative IMPACT (imprinted ancient) family translation regulator